MFGNDFTDILTKLGPTILGVKPAELLNIKIVQLDNCLKCFRNYQEVGILEIKQLAKLPRMQVLFYHKTTLENILQNKAVNNFLVELGYPRQFELNCYLDILKKRLTSEYFPHEVGVFLGYPLKDVGGYMGKYPLKLVRIKGWRYYGSEKLSKVYYEKLKKTREDFTIFISSLDCPEEFYKYINNGQ